MHRQKRQIEAKEDDGEGPFAECLVEKAPRHLREPDVKSPSTANRLMPIST